MLKLKKKTFPVVVAQKKKSGKTVTLTESHLAYIFFDNARLPKSLEHTLFTISAIFVRTWGLME